MLTIRMNVPAVPSVGNVDGMAGKGNRNRNKGFGYEHRFVARLRKQGMKRVVRHYGSIGAADVEWTDCEGQRHHAQLKFSSVSMPALSRKKMEALEKYAQYQSNRGVKVWLITKISRGEERWLPIN